jgi:hypothetical protein
LFYPRLRVKNHYLRGRDAGDFGRWLGARSDVIYTIMSDEQRRQRPKGPRPTELGLARVRQTSMRKSGRPDLRGLRRKSPPGSSKDSTVFPIRSSPFSCPDGDFGRNAAHGINGF